MANYYYYCVANLADVLCMHLHIITIIVSFVQGAVCIAIDYVSLELGHQRTCAYYIGTR